MAYGFYRQITIDHTKCGTEDLPNFPVLVSIHGDIGIRYVTAGGHIENVVTQGSGGAGGEAVSMPADLVFSGDIAGTDLYAWEIEYWDPAAGDLIAWVRVLDIDHTVDRVFYMLYGAPFVNTQQNVGTFGVLYVWDSYYAVWHCGDGVTLSVADSTYLANNLNNLSAPAAVPGKILGGSYFDGTSSQGRWYLNGWDPPITITLQAWLKPDADVGYSMIYTADGYFTIRAHPGSGAATGLLAFESAFHPTGGWSGAEFFGTTPDIPLDGSTWVHVAANCDGTNFRIYVNGVERAIHASALLAGNSPFRVGDYDAGGGYQFKGIMDELRISNVARTESRILAEYNTVNDPGNIGSPGFLIFGAQVPPDSATSSIPVLMNSYRQRRA